MNTEPLANFWPLMHSVIQEFWEILEPPIEEAALRNNIPFELYTYSEFGAETFSVREFQRRDPFTNPVVFEKVFATLKALNLLGFQLKTRKVLKNGLKATKVDVLVEDKTTGRTPPQILDILAASHLPSPDITGYFPHHAPLKGLF